MTRVRWEPVGEVAASLQGHIGLGVSQAAVEAVRIVRRYHRQHLLNQTFIEHQGCPVRIRILRRTGLRRSAGSSHTRLMLLVY